MFTTCPKCALNLAITAADLRIGQGYVRCGRCSNVFNALVGLADDGEHSLEPAASVVTEPQAPVAESEPEADVEAEPETVAEAVEPEEEPEEAAALDDSQILVESSLMEGDPGTGTFETIILEGDGIMQTTEVVAEDEVEFQLQALADRIEAANHRHDAEDAQDKKASAAIPLKDSGDMEVVELRGVFDSLPAEPRFGSTPGHPADEVSAEFDDASQARGRLLRSLGGFGIGALALLLVVQLAHHYRAHLSPLAAVYDALGVPFEPLIDLRSYDVRQLGYEPSPSAADSVLIRATVSNVGKVLQPLPVLRVTMQDRFGNVTSRVELAPRDYLLAQSAARTLAPGTRVDAQIQVKMPDERVDYQLDACAADRKGRVRCMDDSGPFQ